jgi:hypothetical protein
MFYSWMQPTVSYFALPLRAGSNQLALVTRPAPGADWWGIGATLFDRFGHVSTRLNPVAARSD